MLLPDMVAWLVADGLGTSAVNLFYGLMPEDNPADNSVLTTLFQYPGKRPEPKMGTGLVNVEFPKFQISCRGSIVDDTDGPALQAQKIVASFMKINNQLVNGNYYEAVLAMQSPFFFDRDQNRRVTYKCNFEVTKTWSL